MTRSLLCLLFIGASFTAAMPNATAEDAKDKAIQKDRSEERPTEFKSTTDNKYVCVKFERQVEK